MGRRGLVCLFPRTEIGAGTDVMQKGKSRRRRAVRIAGRVGVGGNLLFLRIRDPAAVFDEGQEVKLATGRGNCRREWAECRLKIQELRVRCPQLLGELYALCRES